MTAWYTAHLVCFGSSFFVLGRVPSWCWPSATLTRTFQVCLHQLHASQGHPILFFLHCASLVIWTCASLFFIFSDLINRWLPFCSPIFPRSLLLDKMFRYVLSLLLRALGQGAPVAREDVVHLVVTFSSRIVYSTVSTGIWPTVYCIVLSIRFWTKSSTSYLICVGQLASFTAPSSVNCFELTRGVASINLHYRTS